MAKTALKTKVALRNCERCQTPFPVDKAMCPSCKLWHVHGANAATKGKGNLTCSTDQTLLLCDADGEQERRYLLTHKMAWLNKVLGGGLVTNGVTLFGGEPGAGKSTLSLQTAIAVALAVPDRPPSNGQEPNNEVLYIGAEEAAIAIKSRANRLGLGEHTNKIRLHPVGSSADIGGIIMLRKPKAVFLDSLQAFSRDPEEQVELCDVLKKQFAIILDIPFVVISHVTKQGDFAGLEKLQHAVDTCAIMSPVDDSRDNEMREITVTKNRFGPANFVTRVRMTERGITHCESDQEDDPAFAKEEGEE